MPQEFHPGILKSWNITKRTVFFSTSIGPININWRSVMSIGKRMTEKKENKKGKKKTKENHVSLNPILVAHWSWAPLIFTFVYFGISISQLDCNITLQLILKTNSLQTIEIKAGFRFLYLGHCYLCIEKIMYIQVGASSSNTFYEQQFRCIKTPDQTTMIEILTINKVVYLNARYRLHNC